MGGKLYDFISLLKYPGIYIFFMLLITLIANFFIPQAAAFASNFTILINATAVIITARFLFKKFRDKPEFVRTLEAFKTFHFGAIVLAFLCGAFAAVLVGVLLYLADFHAIFQSQFKLYKSVMASLFVGYFGWVEILLVSALIPLFEEFLFRGLFYHQLLEKMHRYRAMLLQLVVFALLHGLPVQMAYALCIGLLFTILYIWTGSLWTAFSAHLAFNGLNILQYLINQNSPNGIIAQWSLNYAAILIPISCIGLAFCLYGTYYQGSYYKNKHTSHPL